MVTIQTSIADNIKDKEKKLQQKGSSAENRTELMKKIGIIERVGMYVPIRSTRNINDQQRNKKGKGRNEDKGRFK